MSSRNNGRKTPFAFPIWLDQDARKEWGRLVKDPEVKGRLQSCHRGILAQYCAALSAIARLEIELQKEPEVLEGPQGGRYINPKANLLASAYKRMGAAASKLGLTPIDKVRLGKEEPEIPEEDPLEKLIQANREASFR